MRCWQVPAVKLEWISRGKQPGGDYDRLRSGIVIANTPTTTSARPAQAVGLSVLPRHQKTPALQRGLKLGGESPG